MKRALIGLLLMAATAMTAPAQAQVQVSIGINVPAYPTLVRVPNYPVYYAPSLRANYFFYDGLYWVFSGDTWYESPWYNGPWYAVDPYDVPVFVLRVPVRYYYARPSFFINTWAYDAPPHWGAYWGSTWESRRSGWDRWNRSSVPAAAPLPVYQRQYSGSRYPSVQQQAVIQTRSYSYTPRDNVARTRFEQRRTEARAAPQQTRVQSTQQARINAPARTPEGRENVATQRQQAQAQRQERVQQQQQARAQQQQERSQQVQAQRQERQQQQQQARAQQQERQQQARAQQDRAQQARAQQNRERAQEARAQPQQQRERVQQAERREQPQQQREQNRGQERGKGRDKDDNG